MALLSLAFGAAEVPTLPFWLRLGATVSLIIGIVRVGGMILFDLALARAGVDVPSIVRDVLQVLIVGVLALGCLRLAGIDLLPLLTTSAVLTAVIGISLQSTLANLFSGLSLQMDRTLRSGDWISAQGHVGRIEEIGWRSTRLVTKDGDTVFVPNSGLVTGEVLNYSRPTSRHRMWVRVGFHYRHPPNVVRQTLLRAIDGVDGVLHDPPPDCIVTDFGDSAVQYALRYWIDRFDRDSHIDSEVRSRVWFAARRGALEMPYPHQTVVGEDAPPSVPKEEHTASVERLLTKIDLFSSLKDECRRQLANGMRRLEFGMGETVIRQGDSGDSLFVIQTGEVEVSVGVDGVRGGLAVLGPTQFFGEMSLITGDRRTATCIARTDLVCWVLEASVLRPVLVTQPALAEHLSAVLMDRQSGLDAERDDLSAAVRVTGTDSHRHLAGRIRHFFGLD